MIVDHQAHWYSPRYFEWMCESRDGPPRVVRHPHGGYMFEEMPGQAAHITETFCDIDAHLADMDRNGIDVSIMSPNMLCNVSEMRPDRAVEVIALLNEESARVQEQHPSRIVSLAVLPMHAVKTDLEILEEAIGQLHLAGVCLLSNVGGRQLVTPERLPLFKRIAELGVPLFLHPSHQSVVHTAMPDPAIEMGLAWMFDTSAAALSLVYQGVLDECPDLVVVHPHLGAVIPFIRGRIAQCEIQPRTERSLDEYLRESFYVDSVGATPAAPTLAIDTYGLDRILFATDFPWVSRDYGNRYVEDNLDAAGQTQVRERNRLPNLRVPRE
jgi:predicted TIM-barrel fold metal-dependent hydrolase